jgi:hypothetical protein
MGSWQPGYRNLSPHIPHNRSGAGPVSWSGLSAYGRRVDALGWTVVGSVAAVVGALAAITGPVPALLHRRRMAQAGPYAPSRTAEAAASLRSADLRGGLPDSQHVPGASVAVAAPVVVGEIPQEPLGFQPRADLLAALEEPGPGSRVRVVRALTGMRGVGKTQLAAAHARARLAAGWRLVAWVNAEDRGGVLAGLAEVAAALGLVAAAGDAKVAARAVRHWLETGGERCLLVFDNATDPAVLWPFIPATGAARVIITSNRQSVANLGAGVPVDVFSGPEALAFLAERTGLADPEGARAVAAELGYLPLALAQAAAVIADQHLSYDTYLERLRGIPVNEGLRPVDAGQYPDGAAAAVLLSLESVEAGDDTGLCTAVMELLAVLSAAGVRRALVQEAARQGVLKRDGQPGELSPVVVDRALARLAGRSLLTFSMDGSSVSAHRLVTRVIREKLAGGNSLTAVCTVAAQLLDGLSEPLGQTWYENRGAVRDLVEQIMALSERSASCPADSALIRRMLRLRLWSVWSLNCLGDSAAQSILIAEPLLADQRRELGPDHPDTLATCGNLADAYRDAGRTAKAITLYEQTVADWERVLVQPLASPLLVSGYVLLRSCGLGEGVLAGVAFEVAGVLGVGVVLPFPGMRGFVVADGEVGDLCFEVIAGGEVAAVSRRPARQEAGQAPGASR